MPILQEILPAIELSGYAPNLWMQCKSAAHSATLRLLRKKVLSATKIKSSYQEDAQRYALKKSFKKNLPHFNGIPFTRYRRCPARLSMQTLQEALGIASSATTAFQRGSQSRCGRCQLSPLSENLSKSQQSEDPHAYAFGRSSI